jgi:N-methylhydantoinase A
VPAARRALLRSADLRYRRQAYELTVPLADGLITPASLAALASAFHRRHEQTYGHANANEPVQLVNLRLTALGRLPGITLVQPSRPAAQREGVRDVWFPDGGTLRCRVVWRDGLARGSVLEGPTIVEALESTTVVPPGWRATIDAEGFMRMRRS